MSTREPVRLDAIKWTWTREPVRLDGGWFTEWLGISCQQIYRLICSHFAKSVLLPLINAMLHLTITESVSLVWPYGLYRLTRVHASPLVSANLIRYPAQAISAKSISVTDKFGRIHISHTFFQLEKRPFRPQIRSYRPKQNRPQTNSAISISVTLFVWRKKSIFGHRSNHIGQIKIDRRQIRPNSYRPYFFSVKKSISAS